MKRSWCWALCLLLAAEPLPAQAGGAVSYKIDGKPFSLSGAVLRYHEADGYLSLEAERQEWVENPSRPGGKQAVRIDMTIQLAGDEKSFVGVREASSPDEMPVYFGWYEVLPGKDTKQVVVREYLASLDSGEESQMRMRLKIDNFGPTGTMVRGSFSGRLFDADGVLHAITDGAFALPRTEGGN